ncbi:MULTISPECIES: hypothetical protein [Streptomyces]|jgi:mRNA-degrading endonuclease RelE of RelBE toxin-antitoxin system|uniref:mRNA-degrading endonuclease RelE of RelBE toxin-antitoxin system n=2 Tax=Streptomyces phaeochromogenes group TaxID=2838332 RepID=A0ABU0SQ22_9ACTN|nr:MULTISPECIES: hypothetical protein [Streptomyces]MCR3726200.1 mRNA-degrading endonuclease RelE of RelBE toxin-antitoxin system [Streptomyces umbrinus]MCX4561351.1 hypothetical protein [Streptomyces phaeochromogenes]MCX5604570.1 hypothetical protein [Streptomyces phaeochromogenes]MCZ4511270.1 hypothetical protein [Streptomyces sp. ActVer]MDQ1025649.1 mRNA-degrading endonuclease RelE of RelBE toxin-antitoxin system [Streptomyces umbrinus]
MPYSVEFTERAARVRDSLPAERREVLDRGLAILVADPRHKLSHAVGGDESTREIALSRNLFVEYVISDGKLVVLLLTVIDLTDVLIEE